MADDLKFGDPNKPVLGGSVFINNTTYAGCDIKILVHLYDASRNKNNRLRQLQDQLKKLEARAATLIGDLSSINSRLATAHQGTTQFNILQNTKGRTQREQDVVQGSIISIQERMEKAAKDGSVDTLTLASAQTLSLSTYRDKQAVRSCGTVYPRGFTRGPREIAGSIVFTVFDQHVLYDLIQGDPSDFDADRFTTAVLDQLPPVDITVSFANEYGRISRMAILGVEFLSEGQTMSVEDLITENVVNFVARDFDPMRTVAQRKIDEESGQLMSELGKKASDLLLEEDYKSVKAQLSPFERSKRRRNPFR